MCNLYFLMVQCLDLGASNMCKVQTVSPDIDHRMAERFCRSEQITFCTQRLWQSRSGQPCYMMCPSSDILLCCFTCLPVSRRGHGIGVRCTFFKLVSRLFTVLCFTHIPTGPDYTNILYKPASCWRPTASAINYHAGGLSKYQQLEAAVSMIATACADLTVNGVSVTLWYPAWTQANTHTLEKLLVFVDGRDYNWWPLTMPWGQLRAVQVDRMRMNGTLELSWLYVTSKPPQGDDVTCIIKTNPRSMLSFGNTPVSRM